MGIFFAGAYTYKCNYWFFLCQHLPKLIHSLTRSCLLLHEKWGEFNFCVQLFKAVRIDRCVKTLKSCMQVVKARTFWKLAEINANIVKHNFKLKPCSCCKDMKKMSAVQLYRISSTKNFWISKEALPCQSHYLEILGQDKSAHGSFLAQSV